MVGVMKVDLKRDTCPHWQFYTSWIQGRDCAVWQPGNRWNQTARQGLRKAKKIYLASEAEWSLWNKIRPYIHAINTSKDERQGRRMSDGYWRYPDEKNIVNTCENHSYHLFVASDLGAVFAYSILHKCGNFANISTIIGHYDHLKAGVMLVLMESIQQFCRENGIIAMTYGDWDSGVNPENGNGLRYWKHSTGFTKMQLHE